MRGEEERNKNCIFTEKIAKVAMLKNTETKTEMAWGANG